MSQYIYSTLTADQAYTTYRKGGGDIPVVDSRVLVAGKANVANKHFITPKGVVTQVSDEQYTLLKANPSFNRHVDRGYLKVEGKAFDAERVAEDMTSRDNSAPITPEDIELNGGTKPKTHDVGAAKEKQTAKDAPVTWPKANGDGWEDCKGTLYELGKFKVDDNGVPTVTEKGKFQKIPKAS